MKPRQFIEEYSIRNLVCCFSGGKDSLVATHYVMNELAGSNPAQLKKYVVFVDTTVMVPGTREFVEKICDSFGWNLKVLEPKPDFWTLVGEQGFPMPTMHRRWCCWKLKLEPIRNFVRNLKPQIGQVLGLRTEESARRKKRGYKKVYHDRRSLSWLYAPILEWTEKDVYHYLEQHNLPIAPYYKQGIKESCLCGAFSSKRELKIVRGLYPEFFRKFVELEARFKSGGAAFWFGNKPCFARDLLKQKTLTEMTT